MAILLVLLPLLLYCIAEAKVHNSVTTLLGVIEYTEDWGYVDVRKDAHTFWWLYEAEALASDKRPLIMWLQGGPGASSTGFGNMEEIGPKDLNENDRNYTWLQLADLVFVDNPVGAGFSYVDNQQAYTTDVDQIGKDLLSWAIEFFTQHHQYRKRPFFIFCESYGGKMAAEFARVINDHMVRFPINFKGVALGDSWISAMDFVDTWGPYLHAMSYLDENQLEQVNAQTDKCRALIDQGSWYNSTDCWGTTEDLVSLLTDGVSWYNILKLGNSDDWSAAAKSSKRPLERSFLRHIRRYQEDPLTHYMNTVARKKFGIIPDSVKFGDQSADVFEMQATDFMKPNIDTVSTLLEAGTNVIVYNGQVDLICDTLGVEKWMAKLKWKGIDKFKTAKKISYKSGKSGVDGFYKEYQNLQFWYILRAGHMVAYDAPEATLYMVKQIIQKMA